MIPWWSVFFNGLWICGLAVILAGFSYHYWLAHQAGRRLGEQLQSSAFAGTNDGIWELIIWILVMLYSLFNLLVVRRGWR